jgi:HK97 family phage prohead protease
MDIILRHDWKALDLAKQTEIAPDCTLISARSYIADEIKIINVNRQARFIISTGDVDGDKDTINVDGWDLSNFHRNPVVLFAHKYDQPPVASAIETAVDNMKLKSLAVFPERDVFAFGDTIFQMVKEGFLKSTSVGFRPTEWVFNEERGGIDFKKQTLFEWSVVPVPSNPHAVMCAAREALGKDVLQPYVKWAEQVLDEWHGESGLWLSRSAVEETFAALKTSHIVDMGASAPAQKQTETVTEEIVPDPPEDIPIVSVSEQEQNIMAELLAEMREIRAALDKSMTPAEVPIDDAELSVDAFLSSLVAEQNNNSAPLLPGNPDAMDEDLIREIVTRVIQESVEDALKTQITAVTGRLID